MSTTYTTIPIKQVSNNFGFLNKVIWFDITDTNGTFFVNLFITPNQTNDMNVVIFNKGSKEELWKKTYNKSSNGSTTNDSVTLTHIVGKRTAIYGIKSL
jgi:hypothetical protein